MRSLRYFFFEFSPDHQQVLYDFGTDRVAAFSIHRQLEKQGKKLSAVQIKAGYVAKPNKNTQAQAAQGQTSQGQAVQGQLVHHS